MSLYDANLKYAMDDILIYGYDFDPLREQIAKLYDDSSTPPCELIFLLAVIPPNTESVLIDHFYREGKIKSYMKTEICKQIYTVLKGDLNSNLETSLNRFKRFKDYVSIKIKNTLKEINIQIKMTLLERFTPQIVSAILSHFNVGSLGYCDEVNALMMVSKGKGDKKEIVYQDHLKRILAKDLQEYMTLDKKELVIEFYKQKEVKDILFHYFFPRGEEADLRTEITFDILKEFTPPQKRRKVRLPDGNYESLHDALTPYITHEEFVEIIDHNDILDFYPSVRTVKTHEMVTTLIDLDCSAFLKRCFSPKVIWELTVVLIEEITKVLTDFLQFPKPLIIFSGGRGVHMVYRIAKECVDSDFNYVNFWELYLLPSQKSLVKNPRSLLHNKFIFFRTLMEAILLYTVENFNIEKIPEAIRTGLGVTRIMDLFTLSPFTDNRIGILLDSSSNNASVHRIFSIHPNSGLVSIPITDPHTKDFCKKFKNYETLKEASSPSTIIDNLESGKQELYFQFPPELTKKHVHILLQPNKLLPVISTIVRFSDRWVTERSIWSYSYWYELYQLNNFYSYLSTLLLTINRSDKDIGLKYQNLVTIIKESSIRTKFYVRQVVDDYFFRGNSYKTVKIKLDAFHDLEFFYRFKWDEIHPISSGKVADLLNQDRERSDFFRKFTTFFNMAQILLMYYGKDRTSLNVRKKEAIYRFYTRMTLLNKESALLTPKRKIDTPLLLRKDMALLVYLFNVFIRFLKDLYYFTRII